MIAVGFDVGEGEPVRRLVEGLRRLGRPDRDAPPRLHFDLQRLMVRRRLRQAVPRVRELVDVPHQHVVQLLSHLRLVCLDSCLEWHEAEPVAFG